MLKELNEFKLGKFSEYLKENSNDIESITNIIKSTLTRPDILQIRNRKIRKERDKFIENLILLTSELDSKVKEVITSKVKVIKTSEELFDNISKIIDECDISERSISAQVWSHLKRVEEGFDLINKNIDAFLCKKPKTKMLSPYTIIENGNGDSFSADAESENLIKYLSITLLLLGYKFKIFDNGKIILPLQEGVTEESIFQAGSIELFARSWKQLEDVCQRSILFGGDVLWLQGDDVQADARKRGFKQTYHYEREESEYELFDSISMERLKKKSLQYYLDILSNKEIRSKVTSSHDVVGKLSDRIFLNENEVLACITLGDVFCVDIFLDKKTYNELTLSEWIRSYFIFQWLSVQVSRKSINNILSREEIINYFDAKGISRNKSEVFIDLVTFSQSSQDLYDCPLIKLENNDYYFAYYSCLNFSVPNVILSRFSSLEIELSDKGVNFESDVVDFLKDGIGNCNSFKFKRELDEYEYDAVFTLDNKLFILECKNRSLSWYNPVKAFRNKVYLFETIEQVLRLKNALATYPEVLQDKLGIDISEYEIIPVIFNCMPFSWKGKINGVYVTDYSSFSRLLKSSEINLVMTNGHEQKKKSTSKYKQWKGSTVCAEDIINHLNNPIQLTPYISSRKASGYWGVANNETAFTLINYEVDVTEYQRQEKKMFGSTPKIKSKPKAKSNRKSMIKISKKKNRNK
ncbi:MULTISPECIES: hypothetical protein [Vibrio]|uniref:NERD domain-containing protein n=1 Tax=Vibrio tasmaniensis TaxID=212663 RepID=A0A2N7NCF6_9VIBR|nr:hypothetical protein [Vibrio tasmaniensis]PMP09326.1 hypothetical protein BCS92_23945 [Vibrio tasmaniensis]TKG26449.1 hypothetical protein FC057_24405 [Vibrio tasmaniensis]TKG35633.1 hypothetical protein FC063_24710 [Vibrio tasmaniensis]TKG40563.1 hypothetical protein FC061_24265 [Vibrio tasmaniensis]TKG40572.1 hypothetical protein FC060_23750 [Vibrio tasmaniensis]